MTDRGVSVEHAFAAPRSIVWALLADTNRYDRALGLSRPDYSYREVDGERELVGKAKQGGMALSWVEAPYEWIEGCFLEGRRLFLTGPAADGGLRVDVTDDGDGCRATVTASGAARSWALRMLSPVLEGALRSRLRRYVADVDTLLSDDAVLTRLSDDGHGNQPPVARVHDLLALGDGGSLSGDIGKVDTAELSRRRERLEKGPVLDDVVERIVTLLATRPDEEVAQIRPFELARAWGLPRDAVLRGFLHATQTGLVDLNWQVNCPVCKVSAAVVSGLSDVGRDVHCASCNIEYAIAFGENVEAVFQCNAAVRAVESATYCAASPAFRPHVVAQLRVDAGAVRTELLPLWCAQLRIRTLAAHEPAELSQPEPPARLRVVVESDRVVVTATGRAEPGEPTQLELHNEGEAPAYVLLERAGWEADTVVGSVVVSMPEFVDLFATEAPAAGLELSIGRLTLFFSDLTGSTALYTEIGDAKAFAVVHEHFAIVDAAVMRHGGAVVKTMGDAVMATFPGVAAAVAAAVEAVDESSSRHGHLNLGVKIGVHEGACLAVRANDRLDFFGTTVNVAARLQGQARSGELVLMGEAAEQPEIAALLTDRPRRSFDAGLKGIEGPQQLVGVDLLDPAYSAGK